MSTRVKKCFIPGCNSTSTLTPSKLFFQVPKGEDRRPTWYEICKCKSTSMKATKYCCQDHFLLEEDVENWARYSISKRCRTEDVTPRLKKDALPRMDTLQFLEHTADEEPTDARTHSDSSLFLNSEDEDALNPADLIQVEYLSEKESDEEENCRRKKPQALKDE